MQSRLVKVAGFFLFLRENGVLRSPLSALTRPNWGLQQWAENLFVSAWAAGPGRAELRSLCLLRNIHQKYFLWNINKWGLQARGSVSTELTLSLSLISMAVLIQQTERAACTSWFPCENGGWLQRMGLRHRAALLEPLWPKTDEEMPYRPVISLPRFAWDIVTHVVALLCEAAECETLMKKHSN